MKCSSPGDYPDRYDCAAGDGPGVYIERDEKGDMMYADEVIAFIDKLRAELQTVRTAGEVVTAGNEILQRRCDSLGAEIARLRAGGQVSKGEMERLEEFKRQVRANRARE